MMDGAMGVGEFQGVVEEVAADVAGFVEGPEPCPDSLFGTFLPHCGQNAAHLCSEAPQYMQYCGTFVGAKLAIGGSSPDVAVGINPAYLLESLEAVFGGDLAGYPPVLGAVTVAAKETPGFCFLGVCSTILGCADLDLVLAPPCFNLGFGEAVLGMCWIGEMP